MAVEEVVEVGDAVVVFVESSDDRDVAALGLALLSEGTLLLFFNFGTCCFPNVCADEADEGDDGLEVD